jgi:hypothetical protein
LYTFRGGEGGYEKEYFLYACDNDEKDGWPLRTYVVLWLQRPFENMAVCA